jgi:hypothetical protein
LETCERSRKEKHTKEKAEAHLTHLKVTQGYTGVVYKCVFCGSYHVGRNKKTKKRNKQVREILI